MRARRTGTILNIGSSEAMAPTPGVAFYASTNAALDSFSAAPATEVADFGIRVLSALPGGLRTEFLASAMEDGVVPLSEVYAEGLLGRTMAAMKGIAESRQGFKGDPAKVGERLAQWVDGTGIMRECG